ncbi:MAG: prolipoprotein diacylglyceryl transferase [Actinomycetota bacterium]|nr:prolipoprotein diacylglyceryl transferase [Actinomycetota bacterium]
MSLLAELRWPILERIHLVGDLAISPHGISVALGFLVGAQVMLKRVERRGVARRPVEASAEAVVQALFTRGAVGTIVGARFFYVVTRLDQFSGPLEWFTIWEGGLSLLGGITGGILACVPYAVRSGYSVPLLLDSSAPGLAVGIFLGRIGDLVIGEHLGGRTDFFLGWRCTGAYGKPAAPYPWPGPQAQGCYEATVHQTALYDFLAAGAVLAVLVLLERKPRFDGFFIVAFAVLYGTGRFLSDFAREADKDLLGPLTGSQLTVLGAIAAALMWVATARPDRRIPYAWNPPDFHRPWVTVGANIADDGGPPTTE